MAYRQQPLFALPEESDDTEPDSLIGAARTTVESLREQGAIEPWHELDVVIVVELARAVQESRGIAKSQMFGALLAARARLPEPVVATIEPEALEYEGARAIEFWRAHSAELSNTEDAEPVD
jgi:hypothetical protein